MRILIGLLLVSGCTINLQIDNEYVTQRGNGEVTQAELSEAKTEATANLEAELDGGAL